MIFVLLIDFRIIVEMIYNSDLLYFKAIVNLDYVGNPYRFCLSEHYLHNFDSIFTDDFKQMNFEGNSYLHCGE